MRRVYTYVDDVVKAVLLVGERPPRGDAAWDGRQSSVSPAPLGMKAQVKKVPLQPGDVKQTWADCTALREEIGFPLTDAVAQWGNLAALVASLYTGDLALMGRSLCDVVAEPVRAVLIPGFRKVKEAALGGGAIGCSIAGAGPAVFALAANAAQAAAAGAAMQQAFAAAGLDAAVYVSEINDAGPRVVPQC